MDREELMKMLEETGAIRYGHFLLSSGMHSDTYIQCALLLMYPEYAEKLGKALCSLFSDIDFDLIASPALGGIIIGYEVAKKANKPFVFTERNGKGEMMLRRGFTIQAGMKVLIIEDVVTTGGSVYEVRDVIEGLGGKVVGCGSIIDRSEAPILLMLRSLLKMKLNIYDPSDCPLCKRGIPLEKPGSKKKTF